MNSLDIYNLIERAKTSARELGIDAEARGCQPEKDEVEELMGRVEDLIEQEELGDELQKRAAAERAKNMVIAKLLTAADVFTEVSR